ncbi:MAG: alpha-E domain-containing protein [Arachidicoccus sp.]|nr:alpha-E domain-containing protein [Arachidicoccus sp.]
MLSRVAESVFWLARYMERTSGLLRVLRTNYVGSQDELNDFSWKSTLQTYGYLKDEKIESVQHNSRKVLEYVMLDRDNDASLINNITRSRENARSVQDNIPKEVWQALNDNYHLIREANIERLIKYGDPVLAFDMLLKQGMCLHGTIELSMSRDEAYNYLNIGRYIERCIISIDVLLIHLKEVDFDLTQSDDAPLWRYLLYALSGYELYLKNNKGLLRSDLVIQQILYNPNFVYSISYCLRRAQRYFQRLQQDSEDESFQSVDFLLGKASNDLKYSSPDLKDAQAINEILINTRKNIIETTFALNKNYFGI